jgi:predicted amidophosphoribosyltransferase
MHLFTRLLTALFSPRASEALVHTITEEDIALRVAPTKVLHTTDIVALLPRKDPVVTALIQEATYHGSEKAFSLLGQVLADYLSEFVIEEDLFERRCFKLVPIPLSRKRFKARGYNQAERIAQEALTRLGLSGEPSAVLTRIRDTKPHTRLPRETRAAHMKGAFLAQHSEHDIVYIVIDDVVTTGATFASAAAALQAAGATRVVCVALAH